MFLEIDVKLAHTVRMSDLITYLLPDIFSAIMILCMGVYLFFEKDLYVARLRKSFFILLSVCFVYSLLCIPMDIVMNFESVFSPAASLAVATVHAVFSQVIAVLLMFYIVRDSQNNLSGKREMKPVIYAAAALTCASITLFIINIRTGIAFSFPSQGGEVEFGPLYFIHFILLSCAAVVTFTFIFRERDNILPQIRRMASYVPIIIAVLVVMQIIYPKSEALLILVSVLLFYCFTNLTTSSFLIDNLTGFGNLKYMSSFLSYYFDKGFQFSVITVQIHDYSRMHMDFDVKSVDTLIRTIGSRFAQLDLIQQVFRISENNFVLIGPAPSDPSCRTLCSQIVDIFSGTYVIDRTNFTLKGDIYLIPCPVVAASRDEVFGMLTFFSERKVDFRSLSTSYYSAGNDFFRFIVCDLRLKELLNRRSYMVSLIKKACEEDLFEVEFQPVFDCDGNFCNLAECLIRLYDKRYGHYVSPLDFIPIAESEGYIDKIGMFVLARSCRIIRECMDKGVPVPTISVNFSVRQFYSTNLVDDVMNLIDSFEVPPEYIKIEITETSIIENFSKVRHVMEQMMHRGLGFYLDDFGSGYANIARYISLPFECVKIDRSFIRAAMNNRRNDVFLHSVVSCFTSLDYKVIFEGIETVEGYKYVCRFDKAVIQGFFYSPPLKNSEFRKLLGLPDF